MFPLFSKMSMRSYTYFFCFYKQIVSRPGCSEIALPLGSMGLVYFPKMKPNVGKYAKHESWAL